MRTKQQVFNEVLDTLEEYLMAEVDERISNGPITSVKEEREARDRARDVIRDFHTEYREAGL